MFPDTFMVSNLNMNLPYKQDMKTNKILITTLLFFISQGHILCQTIQWVENYSYTTFFDDFSTSQIDINKWDVEDDDYLYHTAFIDSSATINIDDGNLRLTTIWCSNCTSGGYDQIHAAAGRITSKEEFQYGIFESRIYFPRKDGTLAYFLLRGGNDIPCE